MTNDASFDNTVVQTARFRHHVIELRPTARQSVYLSRCAGVMRYTYNSLVSKWRAEGKYDRKEFQKHCVQLRQSVDFMQAVSSRATYEASDNFHNAMVAFFNSCKGLRNGQRMNPPTFKKKGKSQQVVRFSHSTQFSILNRNLRIAGLKKEEIRMRENIRFKGQVKSLSVKFRAGKWFASFLVELEETLLVKTTNAQKPSVGVDLGIKALATLSTGEVIENPQPLRRALKLLKKAQRSTDRKFIRGRKQSRRYDIALAKVCRLHKKIADRRGAAQHKLTTDLVKRFGKIVIENLVTTDLRRDKIMSRSIFDSGWASIRRQLTYKSEAAGVELVVADRFFASSKTCSCCGYKIETLKLKTRTFICPSCGFTKDRDMNAAINLRNYVPTGATNYSEPVKTYALALGKSSSQDDAGVFEGVNIQLNRGTLPSSNERTVGI